MFLSQEELKTVANPSLIAKLTNTDDYIVEQIITESIALMSSYLNRYYDTTAIFSADGISRNMSIVKRLKDIVIYEIYNRQTREQNEVAKDRYEKAIEWLEKINSGEFADASLPVYTAPEEPAITGDVRFGGNEKYNSQY